MAIKETMSDSDCLICGSENYRALPEKFGYKYHQCRSCGHVQLQFTMTNDAVYSEYETRTSHHASEHKIAWDYSETKREYFYDPLIDRLERLTDSRSLLDLGCSNGAFLQAIRLRGWDGEGMELEHSSAQYARSMGFKVYETVLEESGIPDASYDVVTLWQVVEHLPEPGLLLKEIHRVLKPGGICAISTPNIASIAFRMLDYRWDAVSPPEHIHLFTPRGLNKIVEQAGFASTAAYTEDLKPSTIRRLKDRIRSQPLSHGNTDRNRVWKISQDTARLKRLLKARRSINHVLKILGLGEDIYAFYRKL